MIRPLTLLSIVAAAGAGLHVYNTKHAVSLLDRELRAIARDIGEAETRTQALQAEWAWATEQERLRALAQRHLSLEPMQPAQFVRLAEAERRLPPPAAHDGPLAQFAPLPDAGGSTRIALLPPEAKPAPVPAIAAPLSAPVLAAVAHAAMAAAVEMPLPLPAPAAPELRPVSRNPIAFITPLVRSAEARPVEARAPEPRPAAIEPARAAPQPRPPTPPRPVIVAAAPPAPAPRPVIVAATPTAAVLAPRPHPAPTQVAVVAAAPRATEAATSLGSFGSALGGGGSALGSARAALPPPVAFGAASR